MVACLLFVGLVPNAAAQNVSDVSVQYVGAETVDRSVILSHVRTKAGSRLDSSVIDEDIKSLYTSGHVENVRVLTEPHGGGTRVIYLVQTRSTLGEVVFIGNSLSASKLRKETELVIGSSFDDATIESARQNLIEYHQGKGYANVVINYKVDGADQPGFSRVTFIIDEGGQEKLGKVAFFGNEALTDKQLSDVIMVNKKKLFNRNKGIDGSTLEEDVIKIEELYRDNGFISARVTDVQRQPNGKEVDLAIHVDEGAKYTVNSVTVAGLSAVGESDVLPLLKMQGGEVYSQSGIKNDLKGLRKYYANNGYSGVRVMPRITSAGGTSVNIEYNVVEGVQSTVELINISGNEKTLDKVIRRELALDPGEVYNQDLIEVSKNRLMGLGFFEAVDITPTASASPYHTDLNIDVREKSTGSVNFGAGFSSIDNLVAFVDVVQTNFDLFGKKKTGSMTGAGQKIRLGLKWGTRRKDFQLDFTEPWLFDKKLAFGAGLYYRDLLFLSDKYDQTVIGSYASLRKTVGEGKYWSVKFTPEQYRLDVDNNATEVLQEEEGNYTRLLTSLTYVWDTRDSQYLTRRGHRISAGIEGSFGDSEFFGLNLTGAKYWQLPLDGVFMLAGKYRTVDGNVPIFDREFLGGANNLRGYGFREATGLGLRDEQGEPLGGKTAAYFTAEYSFPVANLKKLRGHVFYDGGVLSASSWDLGGSYLADVGVGIDLYLPVGPIRVDLAMPLNKDRFTDDDFRIQFNMGYQFR